MAASVLNASKCASKWLLLLVFATCFQRCYLEAPDVTDSDITDSDVTTAVTLEGPPEQENADIIPLESPPEEVPAESSELPGNITTASEVQISLDEEPEHVTKADSSVDSVTDSSSDSLVDTLPKSSSDSSVDSLPDSSSESSSNSSSADSSAESSSDSPSETEILTNNVTESNDEIERILLYPTTDNKTQPEYVDADANLPQTEKAKKKTNIGILALLLAMLVVALTIFFIIGCIHWFRKQESLARTAALEKDVIIIAHKKSAWSGSSTSATPSSVTRNNSTATNCSAAADALSPVRVDAQGKLTV